MVKIISAAFWCLIAAALFLAAAVHSPFAPKTVCVTGTLSSSGKIYLPHGVNIVIGQSESKCQRLAR